MKRIAVGDVMTKNFLSVSPDSSLHECIKIMIKEGINNLLISKNKRLVGIITSRDILKLIAKKPDINLKSVRCIEIASRRIAVIKPSADISEAMAKMKASNLRRLPVISKGELIGVLTLKDLLAIEPSVYSEVKEILGEIREEERKIKRSEEIWLQEGICENCGAFSELLKVEGILLCADCREEMY